MIFLTRSNVPPGSLSRASTLREAGDAIAYYKTWKAGEPAFAHFTRYRQDDVKHELSMMSNGKCAYCEMRIEKGSAEVEHYRPKGGVADADHPGYWWLALEWTNLLPVCAACNKGLLQHIVTPDMTVDQVESLQALPRYEKHGKATQFPVLHSRLRAPSNDHFSEGPLLIDPTRVDPEPELRWRWDCDWSVVEPAETDQGLSAMGAATIKCVALNRIDLVVHRTQVLDSLRMQRIRVMELLESTASGGPSQTAFDAALEKALLVVSVMKDAEKSNQSFAGMVRAFMHDLISDLEEWVRANKVGPTYP